MNIDDDLKRYGKIIAAQNACEDEMSAKLMQVILNTTTEVIPYVEPPAAPILAQEPQIEPVDTPIMTAEEIAALLLPPMFVLRDAKGIIHDNVHVALICDKKHKGKYLLADIMQCNGNIRCLTCSSGLKFAQYARKIYEDTLLEPFTLSDTNDAVKPKYICYKNIKLRIVLKCICAAGTDFVENIDGMTVINIYNTKRLKEISKSLRLLDNSKLTPQQETNIAIKSPLAPASAVKQPYSPELADLSICAAHISRFAAQMELNIVTSSLMYFENCI